MKNQSNLLLFGGTIAVTFLIILAIIFLAKKGNNSPGNNVSSQLGKAEPGNGIYQDNACNVRFAYPAHWKLSNIKLPLPQNSISQVVMDEPGTLNAPAKNSIFSYICYDGTKYSFDQFFTGDGINSNKETFAVGQVTWTRNGNYIYANHKGKLLIFQMFFTKYDMKPETRYEEIFMNILKSCNF